MHAKAIAKNMILTAALLIGKRTACQNFEYHYDFQGYYNIGYSIAKTDYGYITLNNTNDLIDIYEYDLMIMGIDEDGNQLFQKSYTLDSLDFACVNFHNMIESNDGNFIASLIMQETNDNESEQYATLLKFDSNGDTLWTKRYSPQTIGDYGARGIAQGTDGSIYLCGNHINVSEFQISRGLIIKTDTDGNYLWHNDYGTGYFTELRDIMVFNDTIYAVGGHQLEVDGGNQSAQKQYVVKCGTDGTLYWAHAIEPAEETSRDWRAEACAVQNNGNLLVGAAFTEGNWQNPSQKPMVMEIDKGNGDVLWKKGFGDFVSNDHVEQVKLMPNGNYLSTGQLAVHETIAQSDLAPFVLKFAETGDSIWMRIIIPIWFESDGFPGAKASLSDFVINDDNGITAIGELATYTGDGPQNGWIQNTYIVKLDSMGCLVPGCDTLVNVAENSIEKLAIGIYPNPAVDVLNIHFENAQQYERTEFEIYNLSGQLIKTWQTSFSSATYQMNISELPNGSYLLRVLNESGLFVQKELVVMK